MIVAASDALARTLTASSAASTGWFYFPMPDLSTETKSAITKAGAWPAFVAIMSALHHRGRVGPGGERHAAKNLQTISVGIRALARDIGADPKSIRRQLRCLAELGLIVLHEPGVLHVADPATGRIVSKRQGRAAETRVVLTVTESHMRPTRKAGRQAVGGPGSGPGGGPGSDPPPPMDKGRIGTTLKESKNQRMNQRTEAVDQAAVPRDPTPGEGRLAAAGTGGLAAADLGEGGYRGTGRSASYSVPTASGMTLAERHELEQLAGLVDQLRQQHGLAGSGYYRSEYRRRRRPPEGTL